MFLSTLKKVFESEKVIHRFIYENTPFYEDAGKIDQKNYNSLQIGIIKKIVDLKFNGDINKFMASPDAKKAMELYREYVTKELPFLLSTDSNPGFNYRDENLINKATEFILSKLSPAKMMSVAAAR
jgi:hypothetical protein